MPRELRGTAVFLFLIARAYGSPQAAEDASATVGLTVRAGTPLRLYATKRFSKRTGAPVLAKVLEPVYAFDQQEIPTGAVVMGSVSRTQPVTKWERAQAMLRGDFTPLKISEVEFHSLLLPGGRTLSVRTAETEGINSIYEEPKKKKPKKQTQSANSGVLETARQTLQDRINTQANGRTYGIAGVLRSPNKKERLYDLVMAKLPYHPQYVRRGARFDAEIRESISFGSESITRESTALLGTQPQPDSVASVRLLTPVDSGSAKQGEAMEAVLTEPLFGPGHKLVLPEGTRLKGAVAMAHRARWFHRSGQLRFNFSDVELPAEIAGLHYGPPAGLHAQAVLRAAEGTGPAAIQVDSEGTVKATEPKSRLLAPVLSAIVATRAADNDAGRIGEGAANHAGGGNVGGRTLGGGLGFGLLGSAIAQSSRYVGMAFGYYGLAWSVYNNVIARGAEVQFDKNASLQVRFGGRVAPAGGTTVPKENPK